MKPARDAQVVPFHAPLPAPIAPLEPGQCVHRWQVQPADTRRAAGAPLTGKCSLCGADREFQPPSDAEFTSWDHRPHAEPAPIARRGPRPMADGEVSE